MTTTPASGGFTGDPAEAFTPASAGGCCGSAPASTATATTTTAGPCCGTTAEAAQSGGCCGTEAKAEAVAAGQGCCG